MSWAGVTTQWNQDLPLILAMHWSRASVVMLQLGRARSSQSGGGPGPPQREVLRGASTVYKNRSDTAVPRSRLSPSLPAIE
jgi:hypothetical protein